MRCSGGWSDDCPPGVLPWATVAERPYGARLPTKTEKHAAYPMPLKIEEEIMLQWIPVAIAVLQVIKESMDD